MTPDDKLYYGNGVYTPTGPAQDKDGYTATVLGVDDKGPYIEQNGLHYEKTETVQSPHSWNGGK